MIIFTVNSNDQDFMTGTNIFLLISAENPDLIKVAKPRMWSLESLRINFELLNTSKDISKNDDGQIPESQSIS